MESSEQHVSPRFVAVNGQHLRQLRMERGMTQLQLARAAGYTERLIRKAEKSGRLDIATIHDLAEALSQSGENVSLGHLLHDNLAIARLLVQSFSEHDQKMLELSAEIRFSEPLTDVKFSPDGNAAVVRDDAGMLYLIDASPISP